MFPKRFAIKCLFQESELSLNSELIINFNPTKYLKRG